MEYEIDLTTGEFVCCTCQRRFPVAKKIESNPYREYDYGLPKANLGKHLQSCFAKKTIREMIIVNDKNPFTSLIIHKSYSVPVGDIVIASINTKYGWHIFSKIYPVCTSLAGIPNDDCWLIVRAAHFFLRSIGAIKKNKRNGGITEITSKCASLLKKYLSTSPGVSKCVSIK